MSQLTHRNLASTTYGMYPPSPVGLVYSRYKGVSTGERERVRTREIEEREKERGRHGGAGKEEGEKETKRVTKAAPIALSAPFLEDLLRFCRNPIAPSAIKPEPCPVKGW